MKRILALILTMAALAAIPLSAHAEEKKIDLSGLTYDELVELKDQINLAIWECEEWQEVEVPHGVWIVGEDIPEGKWTVKAGDKCSLRFDVGTSLDDSGTKLEKTDHWWRLRSSSYSSFDASKDVETINIELKSKEIITIDEGYVVFTPYAGKPSLGFKK